MKKICSLMCGILLIYMCFIIVYSDNKHSDFKYIQNTENMSFTYDDKEIRKQVCDEIRKYVNSPFQELCDEVGVKISIPKERILRLLDKIEKGDKE